MRSSEGCRSSEVMCISTCVASPASTMRQVNHELRLSDRCATFFPAHDSCPPMALYSSVAIERESQDISSEFSLQAGETASFVLGGLRAEGEPPEMDLLGQRVPRHRSVLEDMDFKIELQRPLARNGSPVRFSFEVTHQPHNMVHSIAAPTFSLPESIGGVRNWDYRYHLVARRGVHAVRR